MSDPKKPTEPSDETTDQIEDAVVIDAESEPDTAIEESAAEADTPETDEALEEDVADAEESEADDSDGSDEEPVEQPDPEEPELEEPEAAAKPEPIAEPAAPTPEPVVVRKGGFVPMLLGGVIAAGIGAGAALYLFPNGLGSNGDAQAFQDETASKLSAQAKSVKDLQDQINGLQLAPDLSEDMAGVTGSLNEVSTQLAALATQVTGYEARLTDLEKKPITEFASKEAVAAYERELAALQAAMTSQREEIETMLSEVAAKEDAAQMTARDAMLRSAVAQVQIALDTGGSFAEALGDLAGAGVEIPDLLSRNADGVPTLAQLNESYAAAARKALAASRKEETDGGALKFLRDQLGVRSLTPQEGSSPDAILSRVEAALKQGHLTDALAEIDTLPEAGRVELGDWLAQASLRQDAITAVDTLSQSISQ